MKKINYIIKNKSLVYIDPKAKIGENVIIFENTRIDGNSVIGDNVTIFSNSHITNSTIGKGSKIHSSYIENSDVGECCSTGEYSHIKCSSKISSFVKVGGGAVIKNSCIGKYAEIGYNTVVCGTRLGKLCKVGSGVVFAGTCEKNKRNIEIGEGVIVGANATIVAPIKVDNGNQILPGQVLCENEQNK